MNDDLISRQKTLDHLRKRLIQTANNNVGFVCDAGSTFEDASELLKTWLDEVPSIDAVPEIKPIEYRDCANAMLIMWMDGVVTDREYNRIMDKLNAYWRANQ